jgi:hypothetical protein
MTEEWVLFLTQKKRFLSFHDSVQLWDLPSLLFLVCGCKMAGV